MSRADTVEAARRRVVLFEMEDRGLLEVRGEDRVRWLDGMISGDVEALAKSDPGAGCYAMLLTNRGAIVADLHVGRIGDVFLLESLRAEIPRIRETLERFIIADDVTLSDRSADWRVLGLEGPEAPALLERAIGDASSLPAAEQWSEVEIAGRSVLLAGFGWSGEAGYQLRVAPADAAAVESALEQAGSDGALARGDAESLEILRVEAGIPALSAELDEEVLPPEARLERAIAVDKGCYVGQEIVARLRSRGQVNHLLVGVRLETQDLPDPGATVSAGGRETGEITSVAISPTEGPIALAYVRREHAEDGTEVEVAGGRGRVAALPFVATSSALADATLGAGPA